MTGLLFALYLRVSTARQVDGFSLDDQRARLHQLAEGYGADTVVFEDAGRSGETLSGRPALVELLNRLDEFDAVLAVDESRLARDELVAATIRDKLRRTNTKLITLSGEVDLTDPTDRFTSGVIALASQLEQGLRTRKAMAGLIRAAEAGFWVGGPAPWGYRIADDPKGSRHKVLVVEKQEAALIREIYDLIVNRGMSTYAVARTLNAQGRWTRGKKINGVHTPVPWRHQNLCHQLRQPRLKGEWVYRQDGQEIQVPWPAILTPEEWNRLQGAIGGKPRPQRKNRVYPLTGRDRNHLTCSCGGRYYGLNDRRQRRRPENRDPNDREHYARIYYRCSRNNYELGDDRCELAPRNMRAIPLEEAVWDEVTTILTNEDYLLELAAMYLSEQPDEATAHDERQSLLKRRSTLENTKRRIIRQLAEQDELDALSDVLADVNDELEGMQAQLRDIERAVESRIEPDTLERQLRRLAAHAREKLTDPTPELMAGVFDVLELDLVRVGDREFEGTGSIPIPESGGEVSLEGPRGP